MRVVVFGLGKMYREIKDSLYETNEVVALIDNNCDLVGEKIDGLLVKTPKEIINMNYDKIVVASYFYQKMIEQLIELGIDEEKIVSLEEYLAYIDKEKIENYGVEKKENYLKKCLIMTTPLGYHGGALAAVYMAMVLERMKYDVLIVAPKGDAKFINEFNKQGISFQIMPNILYAKRDELYWTEGYDYIIANTYPTILTALEIGAYRKCVLWLHEASAVYEEKQHIRYRVEKKIEEANLDIYAVSDIARKNFLKYHRDVNVSLLPYAIPDEGKEPLIKNNGKVQFALIGLVCPHKQQDIFLKAIGMLNKSVKNEGIFYIVGRMGNDEYCELIKTKSKEMENVVLLEELSRDEINKFYQEIDVLVVLSKEETMSLIATEAMMNGKTCIICNNAGMSRFVDDGKNGFICDPENLNDVVSKIEACIKNKNKLSEIGNNARQVYKENFLLNQLEKNMIRILN